jgi:hypothetical protein
MVIHSQIHESDIVNVHQDDKAKVTMESVPERTFEATVSSFSLTPLAPGVAEPSYYAIEFTVPNSDCLFNEGFKAEIVLQPSRTAGSSTPKIVSPYGVTKTGDQPFFWLDKGETEISFTSPKDAKAVITGYFAAGPSLQGNPQLRILMSCQNSYKRQLVLPKGGWYRIIVPVSAGPNRVILHALNEPTLAQLPNGDPRSFLIGVTGLAVSEVN